MKNYQFSNKAIVRTPLSSKELDITWERIQEIFSKKENREALFIGSPNIYNALEMWEKGEGFQKEEELANLKGSLYKYTSRLANRCTPFGLFATISAIDMASKTNINFDASSISRFTKFDMYFLGSFLPILTKESTVRTVLQYYPNTSLYTVFDKYRYVEYYFKKNARFHKISEVEINKYLTLIVDKASEGVLIKDLVAILVSDDITEKDASDFINTLIDSQFLVSELEFTLTGEDYFECLIAKFEEPRFDFYEAGVLKNLLIKLKGKISTLDKDVFNSPEAYKEIHQILEGEINEVDITKLFQIDAYRDLPEATLSYKTLKKLRTAVTVVNKLQSKGENKNLKNFKERFLERYEEYEQPLIKVLDPDVGIGYGLQSGAKTPLIDDLGLQGTVVTERKITLDDKKTFLFRKLLAAYKNEDTEIVLTDEELNKYEENDILYPDSFSVFFNIFNEGEESDEKIHLKSVWGPSANGLIGRFGHLHKDLTDLSDEISAQENELHSGKILAEVIHLPQARTGNILYRKFQRDYEIPYLGTSSLPKENQIQVDDLYISIRNNKIVLRSKRLNKEIIPRLGNAHNYAANALPIYHFLCDIQNQESGGLGFSWGALQYDFEYLPRLSYKDIVLSRATWNIKETKIKEILSHKPSEYVTVARQFQEEHNIPNIVSFVQGDNEVVINFENELSCKIFCMMLKGERFVELKEFLFKDDTVTENYCNEFAVTSYRKVEQQEAVSPTYQSEEKQSDVVRSYSTGEEWLFYKFYCGERAGEELLNRAINPIIAELKDKNLIQKWFFIRYYDKNGHHLRFRIHMNDLQHFTECIAVITKYIKPFETQNIIWKTQTDSYLRELQRYGFEAIEATEKLYHNDSDCTLQFANMIEGDVGEQIRWKFALLSMDCLLNDLGFNLEEKMQMLKVAKVGFGNEFNRSGNLNKQINTKYSGFEKSIETFLDEGRSDDMYGPIWEILKVRSELNKPIALELRSLADDQKMPSPYYNVALSYLHMVCNRIFLAKQRVHEMVVYDFLYKYYNKQFHAKKKEKQEKKELVIN